MEYENAKALLKNFHEDLLYSQESWKELENWKKQLGLLQNIYTDSATLQAIVKRIADTESRTLRVICEKQEIEQTIDRMRQPYKTVVYMRYVAKLEFHEIARRMHYSDKRVYQLHAEAVAMFGLLYEKIKDSSAKTPI